MTTFSMFPGLVIAVFLSLAGPAWMTIYTDLTVCDPTRITPKKIDAAALPPTLKCYVTGQSRNLLPDTISEMATLIQTDKGLEMMSTAMTQDRHGVLGCSTISHVFTINKKKKRMESDVDDYGFRLVVYMIAGEVSQGMIGVFARMYKGNAEFKNMSFVALWTANPLLKPSPTIVQLPVKEMCGEGYDPTKGFFNLYAINTTMQDGCHRKIPTKIAPSDASGSCSLTVTHVEICIIPAMLSLYVLAF